MHRATRTPRFPVRHIATLSSLLLAMASTAFAQGSGASLGISSSARQNGMGGAGVALFGRPSDALWWNPAMLGLGDALSVQGTYANLLPNLADIPYYHVAATMPAGPIGVGASYTRIDYPGFFGGDGGFESTPAVAVGLRVVPGFAVGGTIKWVKVQFTPDERFAGKTTGGDAGAVARIPLDRGTLGFGILWQNFGGAIAFVNEDQASPLNETLRLGGSYEVDWPVDPDATIAVAVAADYNQSLVTSEFRTWHGGVEVSATQRDDFGVATRVGYYFDDLGDIRDFTFGAGIRAWRLGFDAAWIPQARNSDLDRVVKLTAGIDVPFPLSDSDDTRMAGRHRSSPSQ